MAEGVLVVGSANMDLVVFTNSFPQPGETVFGTKFQMFPGGKGANQAVACSRLGCKTYFMGKMGKDDFANSLIESMKTDGIHLDYLIQSPSVSTGMASITVDGSGENEIVVISGANMDIQPEEIESFAEVFSKVKIVITQMEIPLDAVLAAARLARKHGCLFILNPAPAKDLPEELFSLIDYLTPNETELEILSGNKLREPEDVEKSARILIDKGIPNIIVTLGERGSMFVTEHEKIIFKTYKVKAVDSTAAGDAFNGALAFALSENKSIEEAIKFSNHSAALSVTRMGAQKSMPTEEEVMAILNAT